MKRDVSTLSDLFFTAFVVYLYGQDALVGVDIIPDETRKNITFTVGVPECDLQILQEQYHAKDENVAVIPKAFVDAYQFVLRIQKQVFKNGDGTWRSIAWQRGLVG